MRGRALLVVLGLIGLQATHAGLLGISRAKAAAVGTSEEGGTQAEAPRAQSKQSRLQEGLASQRSPGDAEDAQSEMPMIGKPMGGGEARPSSFSSSSSRAIGAAGDSRRTPETLARGPVTGLSKRQMAYRKRRPTTLSIERAAGEIGAAVGDLANMQMSIEEDKYMKEVMGESDKRKPNSLPVQDEKRLNQTLSSFGRKQRALDVGKGIAGRYSTITRFRGYQPRNATSSTSSRTFFSTMPTPWAKKKVLATQADDTGKRTSSFASGGLSSGSAGAQGGVTDGQPSRSSETPAAPRPPASKQFGAGRNDGATTASPAGGYSGDKSAGRSEAFAKEDKQLVQRRDSGYQSTSRSQGQMETTAQGARKAATNSDVKADVKPASDTSATAMRTRAPDEAGAASPSYRQAFSRESDQATGAGDQDRPSSTDVVRERSAPGPSNPTSSSASERGGRGVARPTDSSAPSPGKTSDEDAVTNDKKTSGDDTSVILAPARRDVSSTTAVGAAPSSVAEASKAPPASALDAPGN